MIEPVRLPIRGTLDADGHLSSADPLLLRLQEEAGSALGGPLAVPQLADLARLARTLGVTLSRPALAGTAEAELDLWVRVEPGADETRLLIEQWTERPLPRVRWNDGLSREGSAATSGDHDFTLDAALRIVRVGPDLAREFRSGPASLTGSALTRIVQLEPADDGELPLLTALAARAAFQGQRATIRATGTTLDLSAEPVLGEDGEFAGYRGTATFGPSERNGRVGGSAEWDALLRQPLDAIVTEAERISDRAEGPLRSDYAAYASDIAGAARHLLDVLRSMGQDSRQESEASEQIDLAAIAAEAAGLVHPQAVEAGVTLELEGATSLPALGQPRAVAQILVNLIGNAVRYSPEGSTVRIEAEAGEVARVSVSDNGPGVPAKDRERIFERFEQAAPKGEGAGLGLAISRRLARSMGGDVSLESTTGKGARFALTLPPG